MRRRSLSIGVDVFSTFAWGRRLRPLAAAASDARALARIAGERGFSGTLLVDHDAQTSRVRDILDATAALLRAGDTFLLGFSGHGRAGDAPDGFQQSWCLHDGSLLRFGEDGLDAMLARFRRGVNVLVIANCCHSGRRWGATRATPVIRANVVRIAAAAANATTPDASDFGMAMASAWSTNALGVVGLYERLVARAAMRPHLEIGNPRNEAFLREGF